MLDFGKYRAVDGAMDRIDRIRSFNRQYSRHLGVLDRSYLDSGLSLAEVRVLYELAHGRDVTARRLAEGLGLDQGYLSRLITGLVRRGWVMRTTDPGDRRAAVLTLTPDGGGMTARLEQRARDSVGQFLGRLPADRQAALMAGLDLAARALDGAGEVTMRDLAPGDGGWVIERHGALYAAEEGYDHRFEALVAEIVAGFLKTRDPATDRAWIAEGAQGRLGSVFVVRETAEIARLRLFLVVPEARGQGVGQRLLDACTDWARKAGYRRMVLWTHESHRAACRLYARGGWTLDRSTPGHAFGQAVVDQDWSLDLT